MYSSSSILSSFPYFNMYIGDMKAWQLYVGQTIWIASLAVIFFILNMLLDMTFLKNNSSIRKGVFIAEAISTGEGITPSSMKNYLE